MFVDGAVLTKTNEYTIPIKSGKTAQNVHKTVQKLGSAAKSRLTM